MGLIDNFRAAVFTQGSRRRTRRSHLGIDRGHRGELETLSNALLHGEAPPVDVSEYVATTMATFAIERSLVEGHPQEVEQRRLLKQ